MTGETQLVVVLLIVGALTLLSLIGIFVTSPVMAIFAVVFLLMACLVWAELRR
jgi:hypothetical protein